MILDNLAFVFPGQGSQSKGMLLDLHNNFSMIKETFEEASTVLGYDLWNLIINDLEDKLNQTEYTQPALLAASVALWRTWCQVSSSKPSIMAGHSLGEYSALVCAKSLDFDAALSLVTMRGQLMQQAVPVGTGAMAAILGITGERVVELCQEVKGHGIVSAANFNSLEQTVIAGHTFAVEEAMNLIKANGAKRTLKLPVSVPSHCALMTEAANAFEDELNKISFQKPQTPILRNVDAKPHEDESAIKEALTKQLSHSVQWVKTVQQLSANNIKAVIECGPGAVLSGLIKRIDPDMRAYTINTLKSLEEAAEMIQSLKGTTE